MSNDETVPESGNGRIQPLQAPRTYRTGALETLRSAIFDGTLPSGTPLVERQLAEDMGVSRAPIREALRQLEEEGLVVNIPYKGSYVAQIDRDRLEEILSLRLVLEVFAAELAFPEFKRTQAEQLRQIVEQMDAAKNDPVRLADLDMAFHRTFYQLSDHTLLLQVWTTIERQMRLFLSMNQRSYESMTDWIDSHRQVLQAMQGDDVEAAKAAVRRHILERTQQLLAQFV